MLTAHGPQVGQTHGANPHAANPHAANPHAANPHAANPHPVHPDHASASHPPAYHPPAFHAPVAFPPMPAIGLSESRYTHLAHAAEAAGDHHAHEAWKVGQYVTLGLDPRDTWPHKLRCFRHALHHHCVPPPLPDDATWAFYHDLMSLVRDHCGAEALRLASREDEVYAGWLALGCTRDRIESDAERFFDALMGPGEKCPEHFHEADWDALRVFRAQWVV
jgi:hypothetical protein